MENVSAPAERPFASVLVRSHDDARFVAQTLEAIFAQRTDFPFEVIVCDDASTDGTRDVAARFSIRFIERPDGRYVPGRTLNALVRAARGEVVVFNNADAVPCDDQWLSALVRPLRESPDGRVFSFANQLPRTDALAVVRRDSERAFGDGKVQATWRFFFSLASAATWRGLLLESPFDEKIRYSEDVEWAWRHSRGKNPIRVVYCPDAHVEHSHNYTLRALARRFRGEGAADREIFGDKTSLVREILGAARETLRDWAYLATRPCSWAEIPVAPVRRVVQRVSHWRGVKSGFAP